MSAHTVPFGGYWSSEVDSEPGELRALNEHGETAGGWGQELDPEAWLWLAGVDYVSGWRVARNAAADVNALLAQCGVEPAQLRAVAATDAQGHGFVKLVGLPQGWLRLEELLQIAATYQPEEQRVDRSPLMGEPRRPWVVAETPGWCSREG
ncbi:hypothetical protein QBC98_000405 [Kitasatospora acidiphila]